MKLSKGLISEIVSTNLYQIISPLPRAFFDKDWHGLAEIGQQMAMLERMVHNDFGWGYSRFISGEVLSPAECKWSRITEPGVTDRLGRRARRFLNELDEFIMYKILAESETTVFDLICRSGNASVIYIPHLIYASRFRGEPDRVVTVWETSACNAGGSMN